MSLYDKMLCSGPTGCGHPRHHHTGTHLKGSKSACTKDLGNEDSGRRIKCPCSQFKEGSSSRKTAPEAPGPVGE